MSALLPKDNSNWPPAEVAARYTRMIRTDAWYSGDVSRLRGAYGVKSVRVEGGRTVTTTRPGGGVASVAGSSGSAFWASSPTTTELDTRRHLPIAQDIATTSADLLFSDPPSITLDGPVIGGEGDDADKPTPEVRAAQQRLEAVLDRCNFQATLLAAAEIAAALGSTGLRIAYDKSVAAISDRPIITRVDADAIVPHYSWGQLTAVTFWRVVAQDADGTTIWRHLELHEGGVVWHALYKGDATNLGTREPLGRQSATEHLEASTDAEGRVLLVDGGKTATSIPNMLPDPLDRANNAGRSDYTAAVMDLMDAADKLYTQFMDEVDDAKSRLFIADSMLERGGPGQGLSFDTDQRIYRKVKVPPSENEGASLPIEKVQFDLRVDDYLKAIEAMAWRAMDAAGYNPNTEREQTGQAMTATEYAGRHRKSMSTRDKKIRYWETELEELLTTLLRVDVEQFAPYEQVDGQSYRVQPFPVKVKFPEAVQPTLRELAETAKALKDAGESALEIQRVLHPDWSERELAANVERIQSAASVIDPVSFGTAGQGVGPGDGL